MPFDSNGQASIAGQRPVNGQDTDAAQINVPLDDIQSMLGQVLLKTGVAPMQGPLNMNSFRITNVADATSGQEAVTLSQLRGRSAALSDFPGTTNESVAAMASAYGFVVFPRGDTALNNITITVPVYFDPGARISVNAANVVTLRGPINAPRFQHIFTGLGTVSLNYSNPNGEITKVAYASWWGIFPTGGTTTDQKAAIQAALDSFGNTREGRLIFENGSYSVNQTLGPILVPRGLWIEGQGERRTTFDILGNGTFFKTNERACKFSGFQFEQPGAGSAITGSLIEIGHTDCVVDGVRFWNAQYGVRVLAGADRASITNIESIYGFAVNADSALVWLQAENCYVNDVSVCDTSFGPRDIVRVGNGNVATISNVQISNIRTTEPSISVNVVADAGNIRNVSISNVIGDSDGAEAVIKAVTTGASSIEAMNISGITSDNSPLSFMKFEQKSTGAIIGLTIGASVVTGSAGDGLIFTQTTGAFDKVMVGNDVNILNRGNTGIVINGQVGVKSLPKMRMGPINDNDFILVPTPYPSTKVDIDTYGNNSWTTLRDDRSGKCMVRSQDAYTVSKLYGGGNFAAISGTVNGTTGSSGNVTLGISTNGLLRLENRYGTQITVEITFS